MRINPRVCNPPLPSVLLANVQSLENKLDELRSRLSYQQDMKYFNILCFTELWLTDDVDNIQLAGFSVHRQDRTASGKTRGGGLCLFFNNSWGTKSNIKEVSRFCSPEVEYIMMSCRPHIDTYKALDPPLFGKSDHNSILLIPALNPTTPPQTLVGCIFLYISAYYYELLREAQPRAAL